MTNSSFIKLMVYFRRCKLLYTLKIIGLLSIIALVYYLLTRPTQNVPQRVAPNPANAEERDLIPDDNMHISQNIQCIYIFATNMNEVSLLNITRTFYDSLFQNEVYYIVLIDKNNDMLRILSINSKAETIEFKLSTLINNENNNIFEFIPQLIIRLEVNKCRWNYWFEASTMLNRRLLFPQVSSYKWYYPVMLIFATKQVSGHSICNMNNPDLQLVVFNKHMAIYIKKISYKQPNYTNHQLEQKLKSLCIHHKLDSKVRIIILHNAGY